MPAPAPKKKENLLINLAFNIAAPTAILSYLSKDHLLGPIYGLVVALAFPLGYGVWDYLERKKANFISVIGFVSVFLTGVLGLLHVSSMTFAIKEAAVPAIIGIAVLLSLKTKSPLVKTLLYNDQIIDVEGVNKALDERGTHKGFDRLLVTASLLLALSFALSSALNFGLARYLLTSQSGTAEFNAQLGKMHVMSWPVIVIPSTAMMVFALWRLLSGIKKLTGLELDQVFKAQGDAKSSTSEGSDAKTDRPN